MTFMFFMPVLTFPDASPKGGLENAFEFVRSVDGRIEALIHEVDVPPLSNPFANVLIDTDELVRAAEASSHAAAIDFGRHLGSLADRYGLDVHVERTRSRSEAVAEVMAERARTFDFTILSTEWENPQQASLLETVLFGSGGPTLLFPAERRMATPYISENMISAAIAVPEAPKPLREKIVMIAWDGSRAAARAVHDSLPILKAVKHVTVATVDDDKDIPARSIKDLTKYLSGHGLHSKHLKLSRRAIGIGDQLQQAAINDGAALLVMGAYGRSRLREVILGGATRAVLARPLLPVLLSH